MLAVASPQIAVQRAQQPKDRLGAVPHDLPPPFPGSFWNGRRGVGERKDLGTKVCMFRQLSGLLSTVTVYLSHTSDVTEHSFGSPPPCGSYVVVWCMCGKSWTCMRRWGGGGGLACWVDCCLKLAAPIGPQPTISRTPPPLGKTGRSRALNGERPMGTVTQGGKRFKETVKRFPSMHPCPLLLLLARELGTGPFGASNRRVTLEMPHTFLLRLPSSCEEVVGGRGAIISR